MYYYGSITMIKRNKILKKNILNIISNKIAEKGKRGICFIFKYDVFRINYFCCRFFFISSKHFT